MARIILLLLLCCNVPEIFGQSIIFTQSSYTVRFKEEEPINSIITSIQALAFDANSEPSSGTFSLGSGVDAQHVTIENLGKDTLTDINSANIRSSSVFDWDQANVQRQLSFSVTFTSSDRTSQSVQMAVLIEDINDNPPKFPRDNFNIQIPEALRGGSAVLNVSATDPDQVVFEEIIVEIGNNVQDTLGQYTIVNGLVNYSIIAGNSRGHFAVNPQTGILLTSEVRLDVDLVPFYNLTIRAIDGGGNSDETTVLITILDSNDNAPQIIYPRGAEIAISEDTVPGYLILDGINTTDLDAGINAIVHFSIIGGDPLNSFAIDTMSGEIVVTAPLDREVQQVYNLTVAARDQGEPLPLQDVIYVIVSLLDVNDYAPRFMQASYTVGISENSRIGSKLTQITAVDLDEDLNGTVSYSILDGGVGSFSINPSTGEIFVNTTLDREEINSYNLLLQAVDNPFNSSYRLSSRANVTIQIEDVNDNPPIFDQVEYVVNILDNVTRTQPIIQLRAVDKDSGTNAAINYRIDVPDPVYPDAFRIAQSTGMVFRNRMLSFQNQSHFIYTIVALDKGPLFSDSVKLTIILHDVNENRPVFNVPFYNSTISESAINGTAILHISATDVDSGSLGEIHYRIVSGFDEAGSFEVDENAGVIRVASRLDFDVKNEIDFVVEAFDGGFPEPFTDRVNVTIMLTGLNDEAPLIVLPDGLQLVVPENTPPGFEVAILRYYTMDPDLEHTGEFSFRLARIYDDFSINDSFSLSETSGLIQSLRTFDRELQPEGIVITVTTIDFEGLTRDTNLTVMIGDVNDKDPFFEANVSATVHEFLPVGTEVLDRYEAVDGDTGPNSALRYFLFSASDREVFSMNRTTGGLYTAAILNKTIQDEYNLTVMAMDQGSPMLFGFGSVMVEVLDSNDVIPTFSMSVYEAFLLESIPVGTLFFSVSATDTDIGTNAELRYVLGSNDSNSELFTLDELTGELFTNVMFDREEESTIDLIVTAVDTGLVPNPLTGSTTVRILVQDVNDLSPIFNVPSYEATVVENAPINTTIANVAAFDADATSPNNLIRYSLQGSRSDTLDIHPSLGLIFITGEIDREVGEEFTIDVVATDQSAGLRRSSSVDLTVTISDVNDNAPVFFPDSLHLTVRENTLPGDQGVLVGLVIASDADGPGNGSLVTYSILMDFSNSKFTLDPESGEVLFVRGSLDRERTASYDLLIRASDQGVPYHLHTDASLLISVEDANDFDPVFHQEIFSVFVEENAAIGTSIITIRATDADVGTNAKLHYSFDDPSTMKAFEIDESTGIVSVADMLDFENIKSYFFKVAVSDLGERRRHDSAFVQITVNDSNDYPPVFDRFQYSAVVRENLATGTVILQVSAQDADTDLESLVISFSLLESVGTENFEIHNETGVVYTNSPLDREKFSSYNLTILANNSLSPRPLISRVQLLIDVTDLNDVHPTFPLVVEVLVFENASTSSVVHVLDAQDGDEGLNGTIKYSLVKPSELFSLNTTTGELTLLKRLDEGGAQRLFMLPVTASDFGIPPSSNYTNVLVRVLDSNNHIPMFAGEEYSTSISSEIDLHTTFLRLEVMDADEGSNDVITMSISSGNEPGLFEISASGGVSSAVALRPYIGEAFHLRVEASDGEFYSEVNVTVYIQGRDNSLPRFSTSTYIASLSEVRDGDIVADFFSTTQNGDFFFINSGLFSIDGTGLVTVANSSMLDFESQSVHQVTISIGDTSGETAYSVLTLYIEDTNEYAPVFISDEFLVWIPETMATGETFFTAIAVDRDGFPLNSFIEYDISLTDTHTETYFAIDGRTGELVLTKPLSYESGDRKFNLTLRARNTQVSPTLSSTSQLQVTILNGNSFDPQFNLVIQTVTLLENVSLGLNIINASATDGDIGSYGILTYGIHGNHRYLDFSINTYTGAIYTNSELDFERSSSYTLEVFSSDNGNPVRSGSAVVRILVEDINDNSPIWDDELYSVGLVENVAIGSSVVQVLATDRDHVGRSMDANGNTVINNRNGYVTYSITGGDPDGYFSVDPNTGLVSVASSLDHEVTPVLNLTLNATDGGGVFANSHLHVVIYDFNDVAPSFMQNPYSVELSENAPIGMLVATIVAVDEDSTNSEISYFFLVAPDIGLPSENQFSLNSTTGDILLETMVDREVMSLYTLIAVAVDMGEVQLTGTTLVIVNILDVNEFHPIFTETEFLGQVFENEPQGTPVLQITASDEDFGENGTVYYSLVMSDVSVFAMGSVTGILVVDGAIDFEDTYEYALVVQATDAGAEKSRLVNTVNVTITVLDRNDNQPSFMDLPYVEYILENYVPGDSVLNISAVDSDSGSNSDLFFSLEFTDADGERNFVIDSVTGAIILSNTSSLDRERTSLYSFTVNVIDGGNLSMNVSASVSVAIGDVNDNAPQFLLPYFEGSVRENLPPLTPIIDVSATDADVGSNAELIFFITKVTVGDGACMLAGQVDVEECDTLLTTGPASLDSLFTIDPFAGLISTLQVLDRENVSNYVIEVVVKDGGRPQQTSSIFVLVEILDTNDEAPLFSQNVYFASLSEHAAPGKMVVQVEAQDADISSNAEISYVLAGSSDFTVNMITGEILTLTGNLDREKASVYNLTVIATDRGEPSLSSSAIVIISLLDENDSPPVFAETIITAAVRENEPFQTFVVQLNASDADVGSNSELTFYINSSSPAHHFEIDPHSGVLSTTELLDRERFSSYLLVIAAEDGGNPSLTGLIQLEVAVTDDNDFPPAFVGTPYEASVSENIIPREPVFSVTTFDKDTGSNGDVYYSMEVTPNISGTFEIGTVTGDVYLLRALDVEVLSTYNLTVRADNSPTFSKQFSETFVIVNVTDLNDNSPVFGQLDYMVPFLESNPVGTLVIEISAFDEDVTNRNSALNFEISGGYNTNHFNISSTKPGVGAILVTKPLDREKQPRHILEVTVFDSGSPQMNATTLLTIELQDVNDNTPVFELSVYAFNLVENSPLLTLVGQVRAKDLDQQNVTYSLNNTELFRIDSLSGEIYTSANFDREVQLLHSVIATATDVGTFLLQRSAIVTINIRITDLNDAAPQFTQSTYYVQTFENSSILTTLLTVEATDGDSGENGSITFFIFPGNDSQFFSVNATSGDISLEMGLDHEILGVMEFYVAAADNGIPSLTSSTLVVVMVLDNNDNAPVLNSTTYTAILPEDSPTGTVAIYVGAFDRDDDQNADVTFSIYNDLSATFEIGEKDGVITLVKNLDYEQAQRYSFLIRAQDGGIKSLHSSSLVLIRVVDLNDNYPQFDSDSYQVFIPENAILDTSLFQIPATDMDSTSNGELRYSILSGNLHSVFAVGEESGIISLADYLDREVTEVYSLVMYVVDQGAVQLTDTAQLEISVLDVNDHSPILDSSIYSVSVSESSQIGTVIFNFEASDLDIGPSANLTYRIVAGNSGAGFRIGTNSGTLSLAKRLDAAVIPSHALTVVVSDNKLPDALVDSAIIRVVVSDHNSYPPTYPLRVYFANISQDVPVGSPIGHFFAKDKDSTSRGTLSYHIVNGGYFSVDSLDGVVYVSRTLVPGEFLFSLESTDGVFTTIVDIHITVVLMSVTMTTTLFDAPSYYFDITESANIDTPVGRILPAGELIPNSTNLFRIDSSGEILVSHPLDHEATAVHVLNVVHRELGTGVPVYVVVTIRVLDSNDNPPRFESDIYRVTVSEIIPPGTSLTILQAFDADSAKNNSALSLSLSTQGNEDEYFFLDSLTGILYSTTYLDYEYSSSYLLTAVALNEMATPRLSGSAQIVISLLDYNDNTPQFSETFYQVSIPELTPIGTDIVTLKALDNDSGTNSELVFSITHLNRPLTFTINQSSGVIFTNTKFDIETVNTYTITARVADRGNPRPLAASTVVFVQVTPDNIFAPVFSNPDGYNIEIPETLDIGGSVVQVVAKDETSSDITYSIVSGGLDELFFIDPLSGLITLSAPLDYNEQSFYTFSIQAEDGEVPSLFTRVDVNVSIQDVNNHVPQFDQRTYSVAILENITLESFVLGVVAIDEDAEDLTYIITRNYRNAHGQDTFNINSTTGEITLAVSLDRETADVIEILVTAVDFGYLIVRSNTIPVVIEVLDTNDNPPVFNSSDVTSVILMLVSEGMKILQVVATDMDLVGQTLTYEIISDNSNGLFSIGALSGLIETTRRVPETTEGYRLNVTAHDGVFTTTLPISLLPGDNGDFCEGNGYCTSVRNRNCTFDIFPFVECNPFCSRDNYVLSPAGQVCVRYSCLGTLLVPCIVTETCQPKNVGCNGTCPLGMSLCPTTNICHMINISDSCDETGTTCLEAQSLVQRSDQIRECVVTDTLPSSGQHCNNQSLYCEELNTCMLLTAPDLCQTCPGEKLLCPVSSECVNDLVYCCGTNEVYCKVLNTCLGVGRRCQLPNVSPKSSLGLIYLQSISNFSENNIYSTNGHVIYELLGNGITPAVDSQGEEISVAVTGASQVSSTFGEWQFNSSQNASWTRLVPSHLSEISALLLPNTAHLRFVRRSIELDGAVWLRVKLWDGNQDGFLSSRSDFVRLQEPNFTSTIPYAVNSAFSLNSTLLVILVHPLNFAPSFPSPPFSQLNFTSIQEDVSFGENLGNALSDVVFSVSIPDFRVLSRDRIEGLPDAFYEQLLPADVTHHYYNNVNDVNPTRIQRQFARQSGQLPGVAVIFDSTASKQSGTWQVALTNDPQVFVSLDSIIGSNTGSDNVLLLNTTARLRFLPNQNFCGTASIMLAPWDGHKGLESSSLPNGHFIANIPPGNDSSSLIRLSHYNIGLWERGMVTVRCVAESPLVFETSVWISAIPYSLTYVYESLFTLLVDRNISSLREEEAVLANYLHIVLQHQVSVKRLSPTPAGRTHVSITVVGDTLDFKAVSTRIALRKNTLALLNFNILNLSQDASYGPGGACLSSTASQYHGNSVSSLAAASAVDTEQDILGLAVVGYKPTPGGIWQYQRGSIVSKFEISQSPSTHIWLNFPSLLLPTNAFVLHGVDRLRFLPYPEYFWTNKSIGLPSILVKVWDMSSSFFPLPLSEALAVNINTDPHTDTLQSVHRPVGLFSSDVVTVRASRYGCDEVVNSGLVHDACCVCGGTGESCVGCDGVRGSNVSPDSCDVCNGISSCVGCNLVPFSRTELGQCNTCANPSFEFASSSLTDCTGDCHGSALLDDCGVCSGGSATHHFNTDLDCTGACFGGASLDACGDCTGPGTLLTFNENLDCTGVCGGNFREDSCEVCQLPGPDGAIKEYRDCSGECFGSSLTDSCGVCYGGSTNNAKGSVLDSCGGCYGNNNTCVGCDGEINSGQMIDRCGQCGGNNCGCFVLHKLTPNVGPIAGGTTITLKGAGFFSNDTALLEFNFNPESPNCGAPIRFPDTSIIPIRCLFRSSDQQLSVPGFPINQASILCIAPISASLGSFTVVVSINSGPASSPLDFLYYNQSAITISSLSPVDHLINSETTIIFLGEGFIHSTAASCLIYSSHTCTGNTSSSPEQEFVSTPAIFVGNTDVRCVMPSAVVPCQVTVYLTFDGQESGRVETTAATTIFTYRYSPPQIVRVSFLDDLSGILLVFDRKIELNVNSLIVGDLSCADIFDEETFSKIGEFIAVCAWENDNQESIMLTLPASATVRTGSPLTFKNGVLQTRNEMYSYSITNLTVFVNPESTRPVAAINGPDSIPFCGQVSFSGTHSQHPGYSGFEYYWSILVEDSSIIGFPEITEYLSGLDVAISSTITLNSSLFLDSQLYIVLLYVVNAPGLRSETDSIQLLKDSEPNLSVFILGVSERTLRYNEDLWLQSVIMAPECGVAFTPQFQWKLVRIVDQRRNVTLIEDITTLKRSSRQIFIPSAFFTEDSQYEVHVIVHSLESSRADAASSRLAVLPVDLAVHIHGGNRTASSRRDIVLDARNSTFSSSKRAAVPTFGWRCQVMDSLDACYNMTATESLVPNPINLPNTNFIVLPPSTLAPGRAYIFRLRMEQGGKVSEGEVVLSIVVSSVPIVELTTNFLKVIISEEVSLFGFVYSVTSLQIVHWQSVQVEGQGFIDLSAPQVVQSQVSYFPPSSSSSSSSSSPSATVEVNTTNRVNLILGSNILDPNLLYTFRLSATNTAGTGYAEVTLNPQSPPKMARLYSIPASGIALEMEFELRVSGAVAIDAPFLYQFGIVLNGRVDTAASLDVASVQWLSGLQVSPFLKTLLPRGEGENNFTLDVLARIFDQSGGHSDVHSCVIVLPNPSVSTSFFKTGIGQLHSNLNSTKDWTAALSNLIAYLSEMINNSSFVADVPIKEQVLLTFLNIFDSYLPVHPTHLSLAISVFSALTVNQSLSDAHLQRLVSKRLIAITEWFENETHIFPSFFTVPLKKDEPLFLQGSYLSPEREFYHVDDAVSLLSSWVHLLESVEVDHQIQMDFFHGVESMSNVMCQQISTGESPYFLNLSLLNLYAIASPPVGFFNVFGYAIDFGSSVAEIYKTQACTERGVACSEACFVGVLYHTTQKEEKKRLQLSKVTRDKISKEIHGSDPFKVERFSAILSVSVSIPSQNSYLRIQNLNEPVQVLIPINPLPDSTSILLCFYREVGGANGFQDLDWLLDNTEPPTITVVESVEYYSCLFYHLSEFAVGLLPSPAITRPPVTTESGIPPTTAATTATAVVESRTTAVPANTDPIGKIPVGSVAGVVTVCLIVGVVLSVLLMLFLIWKQKKESKIKIVPGRSSGIELDPAEPVHSSLLTPDESKIPMDIIQCTVEGKRTMLGKMTVLPSIRLRELRNEIADNFASLKNRPFYLLTRQLCDIEPTTEQQQFVSIVFGDKPIFIRKVLSESMQTKKHFCVCGNAAQFECSSCSLQGYCSPECQRSHWVENHQKECSRLSERKRRREILYNRQNAIPFRMSLSPISESQQVPMTRQTPTSPTASDWKTFIQQNKNTATDPRQKNMTLTDPQQQFSIGQLPGGLSSAQVEALGTPSQSATTLGSLSRRIPFPQLNQGQTLHSTPISTQHVLGPLARVPLSGNYEKSQAGSQHHSLSRITSIAGSSIPISPQSTIIPSSHSVAPAFPGRQGLQSPILHSTPQKLFSHRPPPRYLSPIHLPPSRNLSIQSIGSAFSLELRSESLHKTEENDCRSMDKESGGRREEEAVPKISSESHLPPSPDVHKKGQKNCSSSEPSSSLEDSDISSSKSKSSTMY